MFLEMNVGTRYFPVGWRSLSTDELVEESGIRHGVQAQSLRE